MRKLLFAALFLVASAAAAQPTGKMEPGAADLLRPPSNYILARALAANVAESVTAPSSSELSLQYAAVFKCTCANWYYRVSGTAAVPAADITDGTGSENGPAALLIQQGTSISVVSPTADVLTIAFYRTR